MIEESMKNSAYRLIDIVRSYCAHGSMNLNIVEYVSNILLHLQREIKRKEWVKDKIGPAASLTIGQHICENFMI